MATCSEIRSHSLWVAGRLKKSSANGGPRVFFVNERLASRLKVEVGDRFILRMEEPSLFSRDAPLSGERDNKFVTMNQEFGGIVTADGFGNFGLQGNQQEPLTIFVSLDALQKKLFRSLMKFPEVQILQIFF